MGQFTTELNIILYYKYKNFSFLHLHQLAKHNENMLTRMLNTSCFIWLSTFLVAHPLIYFTKQHYAYMLLHTSIYFTVIICFGILYIYIYIILSNGLGLSTLLTKAFIFLIYVIFCRRRRIYHNDKSYS